MALKRLNENIYIDTDDIVQNEEKTLTIPFPNITKRKLDEVGLTRTRTYARIIAKNQFIAKTDLIKSGEKGAYIEVKVIKNAFATVVLPLVKIGENSWICGGFTATKSAESFVDKGVFVGNNTLIESNATIKSKVVIGDNCVIGYASTIGENSIIGNNCYLRPLTHISNKTNIGDNTKFVGHCESGKIGITPLYENRYYRAHRNDPCYLSKGKTKLRTRLIQNLKECYYNHLTTRIGENVKINSGVKVRSGATIGNGVTLSYNVDVKEKAEVENNRIVPSNTTINKGGKTFYQDNSK